MATIEYWIQIENHAWDVCPHNIDRMTGENIKDRTANSYKKDDVNKTLFSPESQVLRQNVTMHFSLSEDALILRRYTPNWAAPDDRKVNPWDLNEHNPTDTGTMGTIPGAVIECNVGDKVIVHFRNKDHRVTASSHLGPGRPPLLPVEKRTHSLHPHGFAFAPTSDGAYPLSPVDPTQRIAPLVHLGAPPSPTTVNETAFWASVGVLGTFKKGDRVPPEGTYTYTWIAGAPNEDDPNTIEPWPTTAGVWLYHDHSICDMDNVNQGAIGLIVIHNPDDPQDVTVGMADLPSGSFNGSVTTTFLSPLPHRISILPHQLEAVGQPESAAHTEGMEGIAQHEHGAGDGGARQASSAAKLTFGPLALIIPEDFDAFSQIGVTVYRNPPAQAQYLLLLHELGDAGMCINGRKYLGNTPTLISGAPKPVGEPPELVGTRMRFGVIGMGNDFHTFHLHGHRWTIPGPDGADRDTIQSSPQVKAISQFEDTRIFGPANSFVFTIDEGSFSGAIETAAVGEWHMHCHVLMHMDDGMMGSLLVRNGGEIATALPMGVPCEMQMAGPEPGGAKMTATVRGTNTCEWIDDDSGSQETTIMVGGTVTWVDSGGCGPSHTVVSDNVAPFNTLSPALNLSVPAPNTTGVPRVFATAGDFGYHCGIHNGDPVARTGMWGVVHVVAS